MTRRALLILRPELPAVFSVRAATEGVHRSLSCPTGASLLGWAAEHGPYGSFSDPFAVFHGGQVRFSNAVPLSDAGRPAYPVPQLLMRRKHRSDHEIDGRLCADRLRVGHPLPSEDSKEQWEGLKGFFVSADLEVVRPVMGARLRTATHLGRAADGQLFGYQHIEPAGTIFAATIEADNLSDQDWDLLLGTFDRKMLSLGRSRSTFYGGGFSCEVREGEGEHLWNPASTQATTALIRVWALSDLALIDRWGAPRFVPDGETFGLDGVRFSAAESAISIRRYAPWNRTLKTRDVERQVIAAGSVFTFTSDGGAPYRRDRSCSTVGLWREAGLGRVWIDAPMLAVERGGAPARDATGPIFPPESASVVVPTTTVSDEASSRHLLGWIAANAPSEHDEVSP